MRTLPTSLSKRSVPVYLFLAFFTAAIIGLLLYRIPLYADYLDEIINVNVSYRLALGDRILYDIWEPYQTGDVFLAPFLWAFLRLTGGTEGIILFSRFVYFGFTCALGLLVFFVFKKRAGGPAAWLLGLLCPTFQLYGLYYLWYDTASTIFLAAGGLLMIKALDELADGKRARYRIAAVFSGILYAFMAFAYPSMIVVALLAAGLLFFFLLWRHRRFKASLLDWLWFVGGALLVLCAFIAYVGILIGFANFLKALPFVAGAGSGRAVRMTLHYFYNVFLGFADIHWRLVAPTVILMLFYWGALKSKNRKTVFRIVFCILLVLLPIINFPYLANGGARGFSYYFCYLGYWLPFLWYLLKQRGEHIVSFLLCYLTPMLGQFCVAAISLPTEEGYSVKSPQTMLLAGLCAIYFCVLLCREAVVGFASNRKSRLARAGEYIRRYFLPLMAPAIAVCVSLYFYFNTVYLRGTMPLETLNTTVDSGIYKGIRVEAWAMPTFDMYEEFAGIVRTHQTDECRTFLTGMNTRYLYMMMDMLPAGAVTEDFESTRQFAYMEVTGRLPDMIFITKWELSPEMLSYIEGHYTLCYQTGKTTDDYYLWVRNEAMPKN